MNKATILVMLTFLCSAGFAQDKKKTGAPPVVLFDGFSGVNHDHGLHAIMFGPDGRFYFNAGNSGIDGLLLKDGKGEVVIDSTGSEVGAKGTKWRGAPRVSGGPHYTNGMA